MVIYSGKKDIEKTVKTLKELSVIGESDISREYVQTVNARLKHSGSFLIGYFYELLAMEGLLDFYRRNLEALNADRKKDCKDN